MLPLFYSISMAVLHILYFVKYMTLGTSVYLLYFVEYMISSTSLLIFCGVCDINHLSIVTIFCGIYVSMHLFEPQFLYIQKSGYNVHFIVARFRDNVHT